MRKGETGIGMIEQQEKDQQEIVISVCGFLFYHLQCNNSRSNSSCPGRRRVVLEDGRGR